MATKKKAAKKPVAKKAAAKKVALKKTAAKKPVAKKPAVRKVVARPAAKKTAPKKAAVKKAAVKKAIAKAPAAKAVDTQRAVEQFLYQQSEILDTRQWQSFIDLFTPDGVYWVPITQDQTEWEGSPSIFAEDKLMMEVRMRRVLHPQAWSQAPMWATNHQVSNVVIEKETATEVQVRSRFHLMELRRDTVRHFGGMYKHTLVKTGGGYKIKLQRVDMFNSQAPYEYVLQIWV
jgi:3-phenylpropionate/cinnamic acid dioxygenase small subunit